MGRYDIIKMISVAVKAFKYTACVSLLQPSPEVVELFDEMLVMREGHLIYQGPVKNVAAYMSRLGYICPPHTDEACFLIEVRKSVSFDAIRLCFSRQLSLSLSLSLIMF